MDTPQICVTVSAPTMAELRARLAETLDLALADNELAWALDPDGTWAKVAGPTGTGDAEHGGVNTQRQLRELAVSRSHAPA